jgi:hypothetical protein
LKKILFILTLLLSGCASTPTAYHPTAGNQKSLGVLEKITFSGNSDTDKRTIENYVLYRCAEISKQKNKPYFLIFNSMYDAIKGQYAQLPRAGLSGPYPTASTFVLLLDSPAEGAMDTEKILLELGQIVNSKRSS